jgi:hypothetical protein
MGVNSVDLSITILHGHSMSEHFGYRTVLYLSASIVVAHCSFLMYAQWYFPRSIDGIRFCALFATAVVVGLWLTSKIARYGGAVFYLFCTAAAAYGLSGVNRNTVISVGIVWGVTMGVLSFVTALLLIFSRSFAKEFGTEIEKRPTYKKRLLNAFTILIVTAFAIATSFDIVALVSN